MFSPCAAKPDSLRRGIPSLRINLYCALGGIVSPILSSIYLNQLDKFAEKFAKEFYKPKARACTAEYANISSLRTKAKKQLETARGQEKVELLREIKSIRARLHKTPFTSKTDKAMKYIRYADDFIIGVRGDKEDCEYIKKQFSDFISQSLKMELSDEKTLITHSNQYARFLGYDVRVRRESKVKPNGRGSTSRTLNYKVELNVPFADKIMPSFSITQ